VELIGLDVGFSLRRSSSGVAHLRGNKLSVGHTNAAPENRLALMHREPHAAVCAIDAPVLSKSNDDPRACERVFTFGAFQRRCKPGLSHIRGTGQQLRQAGYKSACQLRTFTSGAQLRTPFPRVLDQLNLIEAFPNAFLGVMLPDECFQAVPRPRRGKKFDWLYDRCCELHLFENLVAGVNRQLEEMLLSEIRSNKNHDERAALVCLLTAAAVYEGRYTAVGDQSGGYFFLPPWQCWDPWARGGLNLRRKRLDSIDVWVDGKRFSLHEALPSGA
jgi:hypothetical protein